MNELRTLIQFELKRIAGHQRERKGNYLFLIIPLLLAGSLYFFKEQPHVAALWMGWVVYTVSIALYLNVSEMMTLMSQPSKEWWLTFPYPRKTLLYARFVASLIQAGRIGLILIIIPIVQYVIAVQIGWMISIPWRNVVLLLIWNVLLAASILPIVVALGYAVILFYRGWIRWFFLIPYALLMILPFSLLGFLSSWGDIPLRYFSTSYYLVYILIAILIGWPITYLLLTLVAKHGMQTVSDVRVRIKNDRKGMNTSSAQRYPLQHATSHAKRKGFWALYQLERSRYQTYLSLLPIRVVIYLFIIGFGIGSLFTPDIKTTIALIPIAMLFPLVFMNFSVLVFNHYPASKHNPHQWWLSFPYPRHFLILSRIFAQWVTGFNYVLALWTAIFIGTILKMVWSSWDPQLFTSYMLWSIYSMVIYALVFGVTLGVLQIVFLLVRNAILSILIIPVTILIIFEPVWIAEFFYSEAMQHPDWSRIVYLAILGIPIAWLCIRQGAKHLHFSLDWADKQSYNRL